MPATEAQVRANQANAARSTGPRSEEGKARSRANSYKHGLTGDGVVMPEDDAIEVDRLAKALRDEFQPSGAAGTLLVRRMATLAVRMDRSVDQETAALSDRVRTVMDEFEAPEGVDAESAAKLRIEAGKIALFDPSKEACLARKYEAAAERGFFRALNDLRRLKRESDDSDSGSGSGSLAAETAAQARSSLQQLGSFLPARSTTPTLASTPKPASSTPLPNPSKLPAPAWDPFAPAPFDLPITIGRAR